MTTWILLGMKTKMLLLSLGEHTSLNTVHYIAHVSKSSRYIIVPLIASGSSHYELLLCRSLNTYVQNREWIINSCEHTQVFGKEHNNVHVAAISVFPTKKKILSCWFDGWCRIREDEGDATERMWPILVRIFEEVLKIRRFFNKTLLLIRINVLLSLGNLYARRDFLLVNHPQKFAVLQKLNWHRYACPFESYCR